MNLWRVNLARWVAPEPPPRLVELVPLDVLPRYVVRCGQFSVEVDAAFEEASLLRLLRVVAAC